MESLALLSGFDFLLQEVRLTSAPFLDENSLHSWRSGSVRPPAGGNHEYVDWFRSAIELWIQHDGRIGQVGAPYGAVHEWSVKHQVGHPVVVALIAQVLFFGHHVAHGSRLQGRQPLLHERLDAVDDLSFGLTGQDHLRPFVRHRQDGAGSWGIEADRAAKFWVPKINCKFPVEWRHPPSFRDADETVLAFDRGFIAVPP